jgi:hypothetical protein
MQRQTVELFYFEGLELRDVAASTRGAPSVIDFDPGGNVVNSWSTTESLPYTVHSCFVDYQGERVGLRFLRQWGQQGTKA